MTTSTWKNPTWKCPTCQRWVAEFMSIRCAACRVTAPVMRAVEPEPVMEATVVTVPLLAAHQGLLNQQKTVSQIAAALAPVAKAKARFECDICGKRHYSAETYRKRVAAGKTALDSGLVAFFAQHEAQS